MTAADRVLRRHLANRQRRDHFTGQFDLTHAESVALPATVFEGNITTVTPAFHLRIVATSGSIVISPNGHYEQRVQHDTFIDGAFNGHITREDRGECARTGSELQCSSSFLQNVEFTASITGRTLRCSQDLSGEGAPTSYSCERPSQGRTTQMNASYKSR